MLLLYEGEEFTLSLNSHMRFVEGWDALLMGMMEQAGVEKPIITTYPPGFDPVHGTFKSRPGAIAFTGFHPDGQFKTTQSLIENQDELECPLLGRFYASGFAFSVGRCLEEVPDDPQLYFLGEETSLAVRAFTNGYDVFVPHLIVCWHAYGRRDAPKHWNDHDDGTAAPWFDRDDAARARLRRLLRIDPADPAEDLGIHGLGSERSLRDYEIYAGLNFRVRGADPYLLAGLPPPTPHRYESEQQWVNSLAKMHLAELGLTRSDVQKLMRATTCTIAVFDREDAEIARRVISKSEFERVLDGAAPDLALEYCALRTASRWHAWLEDEAGGRTHLSGRMRAPRTG